MAETHSDSEIVVELAEEFIDRYRRGERPPLEEYTSKFPQLKARIEDVFPAMAMMENIAIRDPSDNSEAHDDTERKEPDPQSIGDFRIIREVGRGGMGIVYEAEQVSLGRHVALKVLPSSVLPESKHVLRFEREAKSAAKLHHTNIVPVFGVGEHDGMHYYVMQFIQGLPLDEVIGELKKIQYQPSGTINTAPPVDGSEAARNRHAVREVAHSLMSGQFGATMIAESDSNDNVDLGETQETNRSSRSSDSVAHSISETLNFSGSFSDSTMNLGKTAPHGHPKKRLTYWESVASIGEQVADALHYAHEQGILHRDIKPSNLLLDLKGTTWVTDFGLAKATDQQDITHTGDILGTLRYMPPEAFEGKSDARGDLYSLGLTLYELLAFQPAFGMKDRHRLIKQVTTEAAPRLEKINPAIPRDLVTIIHKAIDREPNLRYQTAEELKDDLVRFIDDEPIKARRISPIERLVRWSRRNKGLAASLTIISALVLLITIGSALAAGYFQNLSQNLTIAEREATGRASENKQLADDKTRLAEQMTEVAKSSNTQRIRAEDAKKQALASQEQLRDLLYTSQINLAGQALAMGNLGLAQELLERQRPQNGEADRRGWEWRYLWQLTRDQSRSTLTQRPSRGGSVSLSPIGDRLAVGYWDGRIELWSVPERRLLQVLTDTGRGAITGAHVAFLPDGKRLATSSEIGLVMLYDLENGDESVLWKNAGWRVQKIEVSSDGAWAAIIAGNSSRAEVFVVNVETRETVWHSFVGPNGYFMGEARFSPDNARLYFGRWDTPDGSYYLQCVKLDTGEEMWRTDTYDDCSLSALDISPDGRILASGPAYTAHTIRVWDAETGILIRELEGHTGWIGDLTFTSDGHNLVSAAADQSIRVWNTSDWTQTEILRGHTDEVHSLAIAGDSGLLASTGKDGMVKLWRMDSGATFVTHRRLPSTVKDVVPLDSSRALILSQETGPELVDLASGVSLGLLRDRGVPNDVLAAYKPGTLCVWDGASHIEVYEARGTGFDRIGEIYLESAARPTAVAYSVPHRVLAWIGNHSENSVYLTRLDSPQTRVELGGQGRQLNALEFSPNGRYLAARSGDAVTVWDIHAKEIVLTERSAKDFKFAAEGQQLVLAMNKRPDDEIVLYDLAIRGNHPTRHAGGDTTTHLAVSPDGRLVASTSETGLVQLFDVQRHELVTVLRGHRFASHGVSFSSDGSRLLSSNVSVKVWDLATRQELLDLGDTGQILEQVAWSADGSVVIARSARGGWQTWSVPTWEQIAAAETAQEREQERLRSQQEQP